MELPAVPNITTLTIDDANGNSSASISFGLFQTCAKGFKGSNDGCFTCAFFYIVDDIV